MNLSILIHNKYEAIIEIIGNNFETVGEMVELLKKHQNELKDSISFMSNFIIENEI